MLKSCKQYFLNLHWNSTVLKMWRKATTAKFIELYKKQPILWDKNHPLYGEKESREMAFIEIRDGLIDRMPDVTILEIKRKLHGIRTQHVKERNDLKNKIRKTPLLWCYDLLHFLRGEPEKTNKHIKKILLEDLQYGSIERPNWTKSNVLKLINAYKNYPALWDTAHPHFFSKKDRMKYYQAVWKRLDRKFPIIDIKKKIKGLRTQYNCERREKYMARKAGKPVENKFWAYEYLKFWEPAYKNVEYKSVETYHEQHLDKSDVETAEIQAEAESDHTKDEELDESIKNSVQDVSEETQKWERNDVIKLIVAYKKYTGLWDYKHPDYMDRNKRMKYYDAIWKALDEKFDIDCIKKKIKGLRTQYACEKRARQLAKQSGKLFQTTFWAYELLKFMETKKGYDEQHIYGESKDEPKEKDDFNVSLSVSTDYDNVEDMNVSEQKVKRRWTQDEIITLIEAYKNFNGLWDPKHPDFCNQSERTRYYQAVSKALDNKFTVVEIKKKMRCLRTQYTYERRLQQIAKETGKRINKEFWAYNLLKFWEPTCISSKTTDNLNLNVEYVPVKEQCNQNDVVVEVVEPLTSADLENNSIDPFDNIDSTSPASDVKDEVHGNNKNYRFDWLGKKLVDKLNTLNDEYVICNAVTKVEEVIDAAQKGDCSKISTDELSNLQFQNMKSHQFCVSLVFDVDQSNFKELMKAIAQLPALKDIILSGKNLQNAVLR